MFVQRIVVIGCLAGMTFACDSSSERAARIEYSIPPQLAAAPNPDVPLVASISVATSVPTSVEIALSDGNDHSFTVDSRAPAESHDIPILGLKAGRTYDVQVAAAHVSGSRAEWSDSLSLTTPPLPDNFPPIEVRQSIPEAMEPGFTMFSAREGGSGDHFVVIVDDAGDVVWYAEGAINRGVVLLENGNLLGGRASPNGWVEYTLMGEVVSAWFAAQSEEGLPGDTPVDVFSMHHDFIALPNGNFMAIARDIRMVDNYPVNDTDPTQTATREVLDDPIVEFQPDGTVVGVWSQMDRLNPTRIGYGAATVVRGLGADWSHTNGVWYDPNDDTFMTSVRQQDAVVKYSRATGDLVWILGNHDNWQGFEQYLLSPIGSPFAWQWHQHAPMVTSSGTILMFDNGNERASPFTGDPRLPASANYSRAVEYRVDESAMTVEQVWEWGLNQSGEQLYAPFVGDADELTGTGNVLINFAGLCTVDGVYSDDVRGCHRSMRIIEIERGATDRVVFDLLIDDAATDGWFGYRAERIPSLYAN